MYQPIHSDFIIHWTGKREIDDIYDPYWIDSNSSKTSKKTVECYIKRLKGILKYGLWMTKSEEDKVIKVDGALVTRPWVARTCFTELRLSETRNHAVRFGRLGIGFKRFFLFDRLGGPMIYYHPIRRNWFFPPYIYRREKKHIGAYFSCFLKQMCEKSTDCTWQYKFLMNLNGELYILNQLRKN